MAGKYKIFPIVLNFNMIATRYWGISEQLIYNACVMVLFLKKEVFLFALMFIFGFIAFQCLSVYFSVWLISIFNQKSTCAEIIKSNTYNIGSGRKRCCFGYINTPPPSLRYIYLYIYRRWKGTQNWNDYRWHLHNISGSTTLLVLHFCCYSLPI